MNSKQAKALRREMREAGLDPATGNRYQAKEYGTVTVEVPLRAAFNWVLVPFSYVRHTVQLHPGCPRAIYQKAKKLLQRT